MKLNLMRGKAPLALSMMTAAMLAACGGADENDVATPAPLGAAAASLPATAVADVAEKAARVVGTALENVVGPDDEHVAMPPVLSGEALFGPVGGALPMADAPPPVRERASAVNATAADSGTTTWTRIAVERASFTTNGAQVVRFGAGTRWVSRTVNGSGVCSNTFFGSDPAYGVAKTCEVQTVAAAPAWTRVAVEGGNFYTATARQVRYGIGTRWTSRTVTGNGQCSNSFFGNDPASGSTKVCEAAGTSSSPPPPPPPSGSGSTVTDADMLLKVVPADAFSNSRWGAHCDGFKGNAWELPESGRWGAAYKASGQVLKLGRATVPDGAGKQGLLLRAQPNNVYHGDSPRCEVYFNDPSQFLPRGKTFFHAYSLWMGDWSAADDMMGVSQWYHGLTGAGLNPPFIIVARGNRLYGQIRHSQVTSNVDQGDVTGVRIFEINGGFYRRWLNVVVQAHLTPYHNRGGFLKVWINGQQVADYKGPVGYAGDGAVERVVHGVYPLTKGSTPFDLDIPVREMYLGKSFVAVDPTGRFTPQDLSNALAR